MTTSDHDQSGGWFRGSIAILLGLASFAAALVRCNDQLTRFDDLAVPLYRVPAVLLVVGALAVGLLISWMRGGLSLLLIGLSLAAGAIALVGMPELPGWVSVDAFGFSPHFQYVVLATLVIAIIYAGWGGAERRTDGALAMFVAFSAFSGPMFVRDPAGYFPLLTALGCVAALSVKHAGGRSAWRVPFLLGFFALVLVALLAVVTAEDRHKHLVGWTRLVVAGLPLVALGIGRLAADRARRVLAAYALMVLAGVICTAITIGEATHFVSLQHALGARLRLFGQDPNIVAPYFAVAPPIVLALLLTTRRPLAMVLYVVTLVGALFAVSLTGSKTSMIGTAAGLAMFVGLGTAVWLWRTRTALRKPLVLATVLLAVVGAVGVFLVKDRAFQHESLQFRAYLWKTAVSAIEDRPVSGYGFLSRAPLMVHAEVSDLDGRTKDIHPHQIILNMAMAIGLPGAALFVGLILLFFGRVLSASVRLERREEWLIAVGVIGSAVALAIANTLDQGLSLNTAFPLHLGVLLGVGSMLVMRAQKEVPNGSSFGRLSGRVVGVAVGVAVVLLNAQGMASDLLSRRVSYESAKGDVAVADDLSRLNRRINPFGLDVLLERADVLLRLGREQDAVDLLWEGTRRSPMSWKPWDKLSVLELKRGNFQAGLNAVEEAIRRDPTGPVSSTWSLRASTTLLRLRRQDEAVDKMAEAFRFDFVLPSTLTWTKKNDAWVFDLGGATRPIYLEAVLQKNRRLLPEMCKQDPVKARRVAAATGKIAKNFYLFEIAEAVIADWAEHGPEKWMAIEILAEEVKEAKRALIARETGIKGPATKRSFEASDFDEAAGKAGIRLSRGNNFYEKGEPQRALAAYLEGIDLIEDMYSERSYAGDLVDGALKASLKCLEFDRADRWLRSAIYFRRLGVDRAERYLWVAEAHGTSGEHKRVIDAIEGATSYMKKLRPDRAGEVLARAAIVLAPYRSPQAPSHLRDTAIAATRTLVGTPPGRVLEAYIQRELGDKEECRRLLLELSKEDPLWNLERVKAPKWTAPPKEGPAPLKN